MISEVCLIILWAYVHTQVIRECNTQTSCDVLGDHVSEIYLFLMNWASLQSPFNHYFFKAQL